LEQIGRSKKKPPGATSGGFHFSPRKGELQHGEELVDHRRGPRFPNVGSRRAATYPLERPEAQLWLHVHRQFQLAEVGDLVEGAGALEIGEEGVETGTAGELVPGHLVKDRGPWAGDKRLRAPSFLARSFQTSWRIQRSAAPGLTG